VDRPRQAQTEHEVAEADVGPVLDERLGHPEAVDGEREQHPPTAPADRAVEQGHRPPLERVLEARAADHRRAGRGRRDVARLAEVVAATHPLQEQVEPAQPDRVHDPVELPHQAPRGGHVAVGAAPLDAHGLAEQLDRQVDVAGRRAERHADDVLGPSGHDPSSFAYHSRTGPASMAKR
jgi:hypothetical protein